MCKREEERSQPPADALGARPREHPLGSNMEASNGDDCQANQLCNAAARGDLATAERLLDSGADPNATNVFGRTPIQVMMMGNSKMAELLLQRGADPNRPDHSTGATPAHDAAREGFLDTLKLLHHRGAYLDHLDRQDHSPLDLAKKNGQNHVADYLVEMFQCDT